MTLLGENIRCFFTSTAPKDTGVKLGLFFIYFKMGTHTFIKNHLNIHAKCFFFFVEKIRFCYREINFCKCLKLVIRAWYPNRSLIELESSIAFLFSRKLSTLWYIYIGIATFFDELATSKSQDLLLRFWQIKARWKGIDPNCVVGYMPFGLKVTH